jgi:hypothetical protein
MGAQRVRTESGLGLVNSIIGRYIHALVLPRFHLNSEYKRLSGRAVQNIYKKITLAIILLPPLLFEELTPPLGGALEAP